MAAAADAFGSWQSYKRFARWQEKGVWQALMEHLGPTPITSAELSA